MENSKVKESKHKIEEVEDRVEFFFMSGLIDQLFGSNPYNNNVSYGHGNGGNGPGGNGNGPGGNGNGNGAPWNRDVGC